MCEESDVEPRGIIRAQFLPHTEATSTASSARLTSLHTPSSHNRSPHQPSYTRPAPAMNVYGGRSNAQGTFGDHETRREAHGSSGEHDWCGEVDDFSGEHDERGDVRHVSSEYDKRGYDKRLSGGHRARSNATIRKDTGHSPLCDLPNEVWLNIGRRLTRLEATALTKASRRFRPVGETDMYADNDLTSPYCNRGRREVFSLLCRSVSESPKLAGLMKGLAIMVTMDALGG
ncbi:hypothetical protein BU23DRAFT_302171 [Bimuria novae-zelandiae CBS 107.79]|uniref:F-box domain-containing protein n=1 Tax=Bimuria novae-zelandiae CBS 107.79 TaxID=1447943 RepID=A0A6A5V1I0_9PLEO|nr:hypothetical protein BU23DRAFT_302171 [Bimuria novae-zelandiae CBS 107.79]